MANLSLIVGSLATLAPAFLITATKCSWAIHPWLTAALLYAMMVGYVMAFAAMDAAAGRTAWLLGKDAKGSIHAYSWLLFWPYHLGLRLKLSIGSRLSSEPLHTRILPGWWLGGWPSHPSSLPPVQPLAVLDLTCELPKMHGHRYLVLPVWDTQAPSQRQFDEGVDWACEEVARGSSVYVHCAHGHGRSALLMTACFLRLGLVGSVDEALALMQAVRPRVHFSRRQRAAVDLWAVTQAQRSAALSPAPSLPETPTPLSMPENCDGESQLHQHQVQQQQQQQSSRQVGQHQQQQQASRQQAGECETSGTHQQASAGGTSTVVTTATVAAAEGKDVVQVPAMPTAQTEPSHGCGRRPAGARHTLDMGET